MRNCIKIFLISTFAYFNAWGQEKNSFELRGYIQGLKDGSQLYLTSPFSKDTLRTVSKGFRFIFQGYVQGGANYYFLKLDTNKLGSKLRSNALWLINGKMQIKGRLSDWENLVLSGSEAQNDWLKFKEYQDTNINNPNWKTLKYRFIKAHLSSPFTPYIIDQNHEELYNSLNQTQQNSYWGIKLKEYIKLLKVKKGSLITDFVLFNPDGNQISILDIASKNKYTLIDCWASWCGPCVAEIPTLKDIYDTYKDKGLGIMGISSDKDIDKWKKAVNEDNTPWYHVIESEKREITNTYNLKAIPAYMLIDDKGRLIAFDVLESDIKSFGPSLRGEGLKKTLEELLGQGN